MPLVIPKLLSLRKKGMTIYPIIIIVLVPTIIIINTLWNLNSFNRDANFLVRHQAVSMADTLKPSISDSLNDPEKLNNIVKLADLGSEDILLITLLRKSDDGFEIVSTSGADNETEVMKKFQLNQLAQGLVQPVAGLTYDPFIRENVWVVAVPISFENTNYSLNVKLSTKSVTEIIDRTTKDSLLVLVLMVVITLALLGNHFYFLGRSLKVKQLEELDKLKDEFISMAAHELRAPVTAAIGYLQLLRDKLTPLEVEKIKDYLQTLSEVTADLNNLINDLLDVSRIEQGRFKIETTTVSINEVVESVVRNFTPAATQKGLRLVFTKGEVPTINSDAERLKQVITNLVSNSIKYTLKGEIVISSSVEGKNIEIIIKDTGVGIKSEDLRNLFGKFSRIRDEKTQNVTGTGLGLWITKQITEKLGGQVSAQSIYGTGSSFIVRFPL